ncbi:MAG: GNAT family N-acetyltransferase [Geobacteraceae bacterium GWC2_53_11]|nr:MAG: GNAT family N-acetyltransferase [Geobacteraceae bacterium GWC2_53_11]
MNPITCADIADAAEILELQKLAYQSEAAIYNDWSIPPLTETLDDVKRELVKITFLKVCDAGRIIGSVRVAINNGTGEIGRLIVHPDFQGRGIGSQLMLAVEAGFPAVKRFELFTGSKSVRNIWLYERLSYTIFDRKPLSDLVELVFMEKLRD